MNGQEVALMKESLKICKTFVCGCGREYSLELSTDLAVENLLLEISCPSCGEKRTISAGSLLANRASQTSSAQQNCPSSSADSVPPLSFMDTMEAQEQPAPTSESSDSSSYGSSPSTSSSHDDEELGGAYSDMFGDG